MLLIFGFRALSLTSVRKTVAPGLQMQEGSEEKGQRLDQDKGSLLVTWASLVYLPSSVPLFPVFRADIGGIMCLSLVGGNMKTFIQRPGVWTIKVCFKSIDLLVWLPLATDKSKHHHISVGSMCVSAMWCSVCSDQVWRSKIWKMWIVSWDVEKIVQQHWGFSSPEVRPLSDFPPG